MAYSPHISNPYDGEGFEGNPMFYNSTPFGSANYDPHQQYSLQLSPRGNNTGSYYSVPNNHQQQQQQQQQQQRQRQVQPISFGNTHSSRSNAMRSNQKTNERFESGASHPGYQYQQQPPQQHHQHQQQRHRGQPQPSAPPLSSKRNREEMLDSPLTTKPSSTSKRKPTDPKKDLFIPNPFGSALDPSHAPEESGSGSEDKRSSDEEDEEDRKRTKRSKRSKRSLRDSETTKRESLTLVPEIAPSVKLPTDNLDPADAARISQFDIKFCAIPGLGTIVQKGVKELPMSFNLYYYWVWNTDVDLDLDPIYALRSQYDWVTGIHVNVTGNACDKKIFESVGVKSLCYCDRCRSETVDTIYAKRESETNPTLTNTNKNLSTNHGTTNTNAIMSISPSGMGTNNYMATYPGNMPMMPPHPTDFLYWQQIQGAQQYQAFLAQQQQQQQETQKNQENDCIPSENDMISTHWPRFWVTIKKTTHAEKQAFSIGHYQQQQRMTTLV